MIQKYIHISIDDVVLVFEKLTYLKPKSIFDLAFFRFFKNLHEKYGLQISCYCFFKHGSFDLSQCTRDYKTEFMANSNWLRFGFHGFTGEEDYNVQDLSISLLDYETVMKNLSEKVGIDSLDNIIRIHRFKGSKDFISNIQRSKYHIECLLTADDSRISYFLSNYENKMLIEKGKLYAHKIMFIRTTQRFDSIKPNSVLKLFSYFNNECVLLFTHEYFFFPNEFKLRFKGIIVRLLIIITIVYYKFLGFAFGIPEINKD